MKTYLAVVRVRRKTGVFNPEALACEKALRGTFGHTNIIESSLAISRLFEFELSAQNKRDARNEAQKILDDNFLSNAVIETGEVFSVKRKK